MTVTVEPGSASPSSVAAAVRARPERRMLVPDRSLTHPGRAMRRRLTAISGCRSPETTAAILDATAVDATRDRGEGED